MINWTMNTPIFQVFVVLVLPGPSWTNSDNLELLTGTLRTRQRAACDNETVSLSCPKDTYISIQLAKYGNMLEGQACVAGRDRRVNVDVSEENGCFWPSTMQYALLQTVVEECQKKPQCKFSTKIKAGLVDPCPQAGKFVEVAFKCRPNEFSSRTVCEGDVIKLSCNPNSRLVIYDAIYGRKPTIAPVTCQQPQAVVNDTCTAPHALNTAMEICHGKQKCQVVANSESFGTPCRPGVKAYLKMLYTCVPLGILSDKYETATEYADKKTNPYDLSGTGKPFSTTDTNEKLSRTAENEEISRNHININQNGAKYKDPSTKSPNTKFLIYISTTILIVIILAAIFFGFRYYKHKKRASNSKNGDMFTTEAPNVFNDAASDLDNDVDVSHISGTFYDPVHPDMILYRDGLNKTTLRAMRPLNTVYPSAGASMYGNADYVPHARDTRFINKDVDADLMMSPKSLSGYANSQFYYG